MNVRPVNGPHHADDTDGGDNTILVELVLTPVPHDSPEFIEHAKKGRPASAPPIPDWMRRKPTDITGSEPQQ